MLRWVLCAFALFGLTGCFVESASDRVPVPSDNPNFFEPIDDDRCDKRFSRGCVVGHVPVIKLFVEGEEFHDADNLYHRFSELVRVRDKDGMLLTADQYSFAMGTEFDTRSFAKGFEVYLTGDDYQSAVVGSSGEFVLDELLEGRYEIRVQKPIKFTVTRQIVIADDQAGEQETDPADEAPVEGEPSEGGETAVAPETVEETKTYCATLYSDGSLEVRRGQMTRMEFNDFNLHITDRACEKGVNSGHVNW